MCGIAGIVQFSKKDSGLSDRINAGIACLNKRGPDGGGVFYDEGIALGHRRLSIIDTSNAASQPMTDESERYVIIFNGEFFNYAEHRERLLKQGVIFRNNSDTEVLLQLYILHGKECLHFINGFFALAIYDKKEKSLFIARDRFGVKPLLYAIQNDEFIFASEMKSMMVMGAKRELHHAALIAYLQLNYIPGEESIFPSVKKLLPGHYIFFSNIHQNNFSEGTYYDLPKRIEENGKFTGNYTEACKVFAEKMEAAVLRRLISDVPLGSFLSGGIDSSVIASIAAKHVSKLNTFSIGFADEPSFDETHYAELVARKIGSEHTVFSVTNKDLYDHLFDALDYIDEPFADSSALNVFMLSKLVRGKATVALSGDGADEIFAGYNKHAAELRARSGSAMNKALALLSPFLKALPQSRNGKWQNKVRQLNRYASGVSMTAVDRYWQWASMSTEKESKEIFSSSNENWNTFSKIRNEQLQHLTPSSSFDDVLLTDVKMVLPGDMLTKVDSMSMANSLEVRTPFLDYTIVEFAFSLPLDFKIDANGRKKIVRDTYRSILPPELYTRGKQGFEVPLLRWFKGELNTYIKNELLSEKFILQQDLFNYPAIKILLNKLESNNPGDAVARLWGLMVFQYWYKKYML